MNPLRWSFRVACLVGFAVCVVLLGYALYTEQYLGLVPCNLCILQRVAFVWMALWFLVGGLHAPRGAGRWGYAGLVCAGAVFGIVIAIRQLWLQSLPLDQVPACGAGFDRLMTMYNVGALPLGRFIELMFRGDGDCARVTWRFLGLTMAGWSLIWYVLLGVWASLPRRQRHTFENTRPPQALRN